MEMAAGFCVPLPMKKNCSQKKNNVQYKYRLMTFIDAKQKVATAAQKGRKFKIGVTSLKVWTERLKQSDYSSIYTSIEGIAQFTDEKLAREWEKLLIDEFHKVAGNQNDPAAGGTGSLTASDTYVIYVVYN